MKKGYKKRQNWKKSGNKKKLERNLSTAKSWAKYQRSLQ